MERVKKDYELLCLIDKVNIEKYNKFIENLENILKNEYFENVKIEEKKWKPAFIIKNLSLGQYLLVNFSTYPEKIQEFKINFLQNESNKILNRYILLNLTKEKKIKQYKIKIEKQENVK